MTDCEIKVDFQLNTAKANKELDAIAARMEGLTAPRGVSGGTTSGTGNSGASMTVAADTAAVKGNTAAWQKNDEAKQVAAKGNEALSEVVVRLTETVQDNTTTTEASTQAWQQNTKAQVAAMAGSEGAADRIKAIADAQSQLADASTGNWQKSVQPVRDYTASLDLQKKSFAELLATQEDLLKARAAATSAEEVKELDRMLGSVRKNMRMVGEVAKSSGAQIIGSQRTVQGAFNATIRLWRRGQLTLKGLTEGVKMFAKSTIFLAAIQLAWELLVKVWDNAKTALFGTAEAAEKAKEEQEKLKTAAEEAGEALIKAQDALSDARREKKRQEAAEEFKRQIKEQNDEFTRQIKLVDEATAAQLRQLAVTAKEEDKQIALEKLQLQQDKMLGLVDEIEYQERLMAIERKAADQRRQNEVQRKEVEATAARECLRVADTKLQNVNAEKMMDTSGYELIKEEVEAIIADYEERKAYYEGQGGGKERVRLEQKLEKLQTRFAKYEKRGGVNSANSGVARGARNLLSHIENVEARIQALEDAEIAMLTTYENIPEAVRKAGMTNAAVANYGRQKEYINTHNAGIEKRREDAQKEVEKAEETLLKKQIDRDNAAQDAAQAAYDAAEIDAKRLAIAQETYEEQKKDQANEEKIRKLREEVDYLEYDVLKKRMAKARAEAEEYGERTPEGKRRRDVLGVYETEYTQRKAAGRAARGRVEFAGRGAGRHDSQEVIELAGKLAGDAQTKQEVVDLQGVVNVLKMAVASKGQTDDKAAREMLRAIENVLTVAQRAEMQANKAYREIMQVKQKTAKAL